MIQIREYTYPIITLHLFDTKEESYFRFVGNIKNDIELADVCVQICERGLEGYSIRFNTRIINIDKYGQLEEWPKGMYDKSQELFSRLYRIRKEMMYKDTNPGAYALEKKYGV